MHAATLWDARIRMMCLRKTQMLEIPVEMCVEVFAIILATMARAATIVVIVISVICSK